MKALLCRNQILATLIVLTAPLMRAQAGVSIRATDSTSAETWPGQTPDTGTIRISRTGSPTNPLTVWLKVDGTAVRHSDYTFGSSVGGAVTIPAGSSDLEIEIIPVDNTAPEITEHVRIKLEDETSSGANVPYRIDDDNDRTWVTIFDNDDPNLPPRAVVSVTALSAAEEGAAGSLVPGAFRIARTANLNVEVDVTYAVGGSGTPGTDYLALSGTAVIKAGDAFVDVEVVPLDDGIQESDETVTLTIFPSSCEGLFPPPPECYLVGSPALAGLAILDDELPPVVALQVRQDLEEFGLPASVNGTLSGSVHTGFIASYSILVDGIVQLSGNPNHPEPPPAGTEFLLEFSLPGLTAGVHEIQAIIIGNQGTSATTTRTLNIIDRQPPPVPVSYEIIALDSDAAETAPGEPANPAKFQFIQRGTPLGFTFFRYKFSGSSQESGDYTINYGESVSSMDGNTPVRSQEITIQPVDDLLVEGTEDAKMELCFAIVVFIYGVGAPIGETCTGGTPGMHATITIRDNDTVPPPFPLVSITANEGEPSEVSVHSGQSQKPGLFTISLTAPTSEDVSVNYRVAEDEATTRAESAIATEGVDFESLPGVAVIPAGELSTTVVVKPVFDTMLEGNESVVLTLLPDGTGGERYLLDPEVRNSATLVIHDYAPAETPVVRIKTTDSKASEANSSSSTASLLVQRSGNVAKDLAIRYDLDGAADNGVDYARLPGTLTIPAGETDKSLLIAPLVDGVTEPVETVGVRLRPAPLEVFPPPYLLGAFSDMPTAAGISIRDLPDSLETPGSSPIQDIICKPLDGHVVLALPGPSASPRGETISWSVEASADLEHWTEIGRTIDREEFVDVNAGNAPRRFYRFREIPFIAP